MSWHFLERWLEKANQHSTLIGKFWITFLIVCRMIVIGSLGDRVYADEQSEFRCNTAQPGCNNVCFNNFSPISHLRFWGFQMMVVTFPSVIFLIYSGHQTKIKVDAEKDKQMKDKQTEKEKLKSKHKSMSRKASMMRNASNDHYLPPYGKDPFPNRMTSGNHQFKSIEGVNSGRYDYTIPSEYPADRSIIEHQSNLPGKSHHHHANQNFRRCTSDIASCRSNTKNTVVIPMTGGCPSKSKSPRSRDPKRLASRSSDLAKEAIPELMISDEDKSPSRRSSRNSRKSKSSSKKCRKKSTNSERNSPVKGLASSASPVKINEPGAPSPYTEAATSEISEGLTSEYYKNDNIREAKIAHLKQTFSSFKVELTPVSELTKFLKNSASYQNNLSNLQNHVHDSTQNINSNNNNVNKLQLSGSFTSYDVSFISTFNQNRNNNNNNNIITFETKETQNRNYLNYKKWENFIWKSKPLPEPDYKLVTPNHITKSGGREAGQENEYWQANTQPFPATPKIQLDKTVSTHFKLYSLSVVFRLIFEIIFAYFQYRFFGFEVPNMVKCDIFPCPGDRVDCFISRSMEKTIFLNFMFGFTILCIVLNALELNYLVYLFLTRMKIAIQARKYRKSSKKYNQNNMIEEFVPEHQLEFSARMLGKDGSEPSAGDKKTTSFAAMPRLNPMAETPSTTRRRRRKLCCLVYFFKTCYRYKIVYPEFLKFSSCFSFLPRNKYKNFSDEFKSSTKLTYSKSINKFKNSRIGGLLGVSADSGKKVIQPVDQTPNQKFSTSPQRTSKIPENSLENTENQSIPNKTNVDIRIEAASLNNRNSNKSGFSVNTHQHMSPLAAHNIRPDAVLKSSYDSSKNYSLNVTHKSADSNLTTSSPNQHQMIDGNKLLVNDRDKSRHMSSTSNLSHKSNESKKNKCNLYSASRYSDHSLHSTRIFKSK